MAKTKITPLLASHENQPKKGGTLNEQNNEEDNSDPGKIKRKLRWTQTRFKR
jgi:hypothetical protein